MYQCDQDHTKSIQKIASIAAIIGAKETTPQKALESILKIVFFARK